MLHIFTIAVRQIIHTFALAIENSQILMFSRITFQKRRKFGFYFRFPSFCFLEVKPLDFHCELNFSFLVLCSVLLLLPLPLYTISSKITHVRQWIYVWILIVHTLRKIWRKLSALVKFKSRYIISYKTFE